MRYDRSLKRKWIKEFLNRKVMLLGRRGKPGLPEWVLAGKRCQAENRITGRCNQPVYHKQQKYCYYHQKLYDKLTTPIFKWEEVKHETVDNYQVEKAGSGLEWQTGILKEVT